MAIDEILEKVAQLSVSERLRVMEAIWDSLEDSPETLDMSEAQIRELDRRYEAHVKDPSSSIPWEIARHRLGSAD